MTNETDLMMINTLRMLSIDMVEKAKSGHPGLPLGAAPMAYTLWTKFLKHNPKDPKWHNRDRVVLSAGHGSALLYSLLHMSGYGLNMDDLKQFRQWGSRTPGHPEHGVTPGVEATTGPLGQGFAMGVGMAVAEKVLADCFNPADISVISHYTYGIVSDGDLMEGVTSEAASLAGTMKLGKLIYLYDDNHVSLEGPTSYSFTENVMERFDAYGWQTIRVTDGEDVEMIAGAIKQAQAEIGKPSLILVRTHIGYGSPRQDTYLAHGEPLGPEGVRETKKFFGWPEDKDFFVPEQAYDFFGALAEEGAEKQKEWTEMVHEYRQKDNYLAAVLSKYLTSSINPELEKSMPRFSPEEKPMATRSASEIIMNSIEKFMPEFIGGSADLNPSTKTFLKGFGDVGPEKGCARNLHFGVREHAMGAIINGMALHGGLIPYSATFLIFSDYMRPAIRLACLMQSHSIFVFTHDSIGLGEDGPTHQPVEQLAGLRMVPGMTLFRPADANEASSAWYQAIIRKKPCVLVFTRQALPILDHDNHNIFHGTAKGGYIISDTAEKPDILIIATGSEVSLAIAAKEKLVEKGIKARVVSMPSYEVFMEQSHEYRDHTIPPGVKKRIVIEAGVSAFWRGIAGDKGIIIGVDKFGSSAPGSTVMEKYGFTVDNVVEKAMGLVGA